jgi:multiple antibiotic resistance protein
VWVGQFFLLLLGISSGALIATGGIALLHQGLPLMTRGAKAEGSEQRMQEAGGGVDWDELAIVPLLFPLTIGGGTVAVAVAAGGRFPTWADLGVLSLTIAAMVPVVAATFLAAGPVSTRLSAGAQDVLARVSGIILVAEALHLLVEGFAKLIAATPFGAAMIGHAAP